MPGKFTKDEKAFYSVLPRLLISSSPEKIQLGQITKARWGACVSTLPDASKSSGAKVLYTAGLQNTEEIRLIMQMYAEGLSMTDQHTEILTWCTQ